MFEGNFNYFPFKFFSEIVERCSVDLLLLQNICISLPYSLLLSNISYGLSQLLLVFSCRYHSFLERFGCF